MGKTLLWAAVGAAASSILCILAALVGGNEIVISAMLVENTTGLLMVPALAGAVAGGVASVARGR